MCMKIIEFCGNPGVGKSTLITALTKEMCHRGIKTVCYIPGTKVGFDFWPLLSKFIIWYYDKKFNKEKHYKEQYKEFCDYVSKSEYDNCALHTHRILELIYILEHLAGKKTEYLLMDEGYLIRIAAYVCERALSEDELAYFSSFINSHVYDKYDVHIAYCSVEQELMVERIHKRGRGRVTDRLCMLKDNQLIQLINTFEHNRRALIDRVHKKGMIDIQTESYNVSDVCDKILLATNS